MCCLIFTSIFKIFVILFDSYKDMLYNCTIKVRDKPTYCKNIFIMATLYPSADLVEFVKNNSRRDSFLYNNRHHLVLRDGEFTILGNTNNEQYDVNHKFIKEYFDTPTK